ncbi:hypothetical protein EIN_361460 [Entamoeba invadens IP1]|uniref:TLDc domain-containing protein n=1 Tax=Entamoeba invadens IP1 TaxID=370355 RepID=A0A0A1U7Q7_ENTIV|nr:hypothetical protein EIN_361460 [Entamoeba invadens IP1]ELP90923.1 hypothetical protein EIN_361460 [Entamoeba invadens IP1]|eukprot:XP_004257694.1 hypothetical protein EIN_361460 [Entamoeba invadens IP1]
MYCDGLFTFQDKIQILKWTSKKVGKCLFNSDVNNCEKDLCDFSEAVSMCDNGFLIVIQDLTQNLFGVCVSMRVNAEGMFVKDDDCFVFVMRQFGSVNYEKYHIKDRMKNFAFFIGRKCDNVVFDAGNGDVTVLKKNRAHMILCHCGINSFNYKDRKTTLCCNEYSGVMEIKRYILFKLERK